MWTWDNIRNHNSFSTVLYATTVRKIHRDKLSVTCVCYDKDMETFHCGDLVSFHTRAERPVHSIWLSFEKKDGEIFFFHSTVSFQTSPHYKATYCTSLSLCDLSASYRVVTSSFLSPTPLHLNCLMPYFIWRTTLINQHMSCNTTTRTAHVCVWDLWGEEGEGSLDQQPHQPLRVKDELVTTGLLVSRRDWSGKRRKEDLLLCTFPWKQTQLLTEQMWFLSFYLMIVCMPLTWGVLSRTLRVWGRGWAWCAEARAAL